MPRRPAAHFQPDRYSANAAVRRTPQVGVSRIKLAVIRHLPALVRTGAQHRCRSQQLQYGVQQYVWPDPHGVGSEDHAVRVEVCFLSATCWETETQIRHGCWSLIKTRCRGKDLIFEIAKSNYYSVIFLVQCAGGLTNETCCDCSVRYRDPVDAFRRVGVGSPFFRGDLFGRADPEDRRESRSVSVPQSTLVPARGSSR